MLEGNFEGTTGQVVAVILVIVAVLMLFYVYTFARDRKLLVFGGNEKMCGGSDQMCSCAGNET